MGVSDVSVMLRASSREECQAQLDRVCALLGASATMAPASYAGDRWIARAVLTPQAPAVVGGGLVEAG